LSDGVKFLFFSHFFEPSFLTSFPKPTPFLAKGLFYPDTDRGSYAIECGRFVAEHFLGRFVTQKTLIAVVNVFSSALGPVMVSLTGKARLHYQAKSRVKLTDNFA
jgi:hypothetical protein